MTSDLSSRVPLAGCARVPGFPQPGSCPVGVVSFVARSQVPHRESVPVEGALQRSVRPVDVAHTGLGSSLGRGPGNQQAHTQGGRARLLYSSPFPP